MTVVPSSSAGIKSRVLAITWLLNILLAAFLAENLWMDGWLHAKFAGFPSLAPEPLSAGWFVLFGVGGVCCVVLVVCQILVSLHRHIPLPIKICTGIAVVGAGALWGLWFSGTSRASADEQPRKHVVTLTWNASTSPVAGYNVYRKTAKKEKYKETDKINKNLVKELRYADDTVESGKTYYYVTRSDDGKGNESVDSNEVVVKVPK
jgi:hypothetical protein